MNFRVWLENEEKMPATKKNLVVFDFDGTIANVPERPYDWSGKDWWGHHDSLSDPYYDGNVNDEVVEAFKKANADPDTHAILLTGRRGVVAPAVRRVLRNNGLHGRRVIPDSNKHVLDKHLNAVKIGHDEEHPTPAHDEYYSGDHSTEEDYPKGPKGKPDGSTLVHKFYVINKLVNPQTESVEFWEDREDHIPHFIKLGMDLLNKYGVERGGNLKQVILHRVYPPAFRGGQGAVQHIPIRKGMNH